MNEDEARSTIEVIKSGANGVAPSNPVGTIPGIGPGITLPLDVNHAVRVLVASFSPEELTTLSRGLSNVVRELDKIGKTRSVPQKPKPKSKKF